MLSQHISQCSLTAANIACNGNVLLAFFELIICASLRSIES